MTEQQSWQFDEGNEIVPGRHALRLLGGGRRYEAYLAWDDDMYCLVVVKLLRPNLTDDKSALKTMAAEAAALRRLNHPVLLRCFDAVLDGPRPHLVLEFLEGPRLSTLLRKQRRLDIQQVVPLGVQLCSALHYMHRHEMVHLDVKPRNIIMGAPPRLIDLSVARTFAEAERAQNPIGTDAYMAPEQCQPKLVGGMGPKSDVWGWGVTMYEAVTGTLPFPRVTDSSDESERFPQLYLDPLPFDSDTPPALGDIVMTCLEKRPENRPDQTEVAESLGPLVAALPRRIVFGRLRPRMR